MAILPIYIYDQTVLRQKAKLVRKPDPQLTKFAEDMLETMHNANGIGLAANQVGSLHRLIVVDVSEMEETRGMKPIAMLNPEVVREEGSIIMEEGCLSIPEIRDEVDRPEHIFVRYKDLELKDAQIEAGGILARVIQHEIDHLDGVLFIDHLNMLKRKLLRGRLNKMRKGEVEVNYPVVGGLPASTSAHIPAGSHTIPGTHAEAAQHSPADQGHQKTRPELK